MLSDSADRSRLRCFTLLSATLGVALVLSDGKVAFASSDTIAADEGSSTLQVSSDSYPGQEDGFVRGMCASTAHARTHAKATPCRVRVRSRGAPTRDRPFRRDEQGNEVYRYNNTDYNNNQVLHFRTTVAASAEHCCDCCSCECARRCTSFLPKTTTPGAPAARLVIHTSATSTRPAVETTTTARCRMRS